MRLIKKKNSEIEMQYELLSQYCNKLEEKCERIYGGYNERGFDHIVSLGYNCEVSFRINDYLEREIDSYPLSWAYVFEQSSTSLH